MAIRRFPVKPEEGFPAPCSACRGSTGRTLAPPLVVSRDEIDRMASIADEALTIAEGEFAGEFAG